MTLNLTAQPEGGTEVSEEGGKGKGDFVGAALGERLWSPGPVCEPWPH